MKILRCWCSNPTGGKLFAINLLFTTKQYKVDNIDNFVYYGKTRMTCHFSCLQEVDSKRTVLVIEMSNCNRKKVIIVVNKNRRYQKDKNKYKLKLYPSMTNGIS